MLRQFSLAAGKECESKAWEVSRSEQNRFQKRSGPGRGVKKPDQAVTPAMCKAYPREMSVQNGCGETACRKGL